MDMVDCGLFLGWGKRKGSLDNYINNILWNDYKNKNLKYTQKTFTKFVSIQLLMNRITRMNQDVVKNVITTTEGMGQG